MKNKIILILSGLIVANTVLGDVGGEEDVFETKEDVFGSNEAQQINAEPTITNEELKIQEFYRIEDCPQAGMDQYIINMPVEDTGIPVIHISNYLHVLRPLYTDKAKKLGKKPIVFKWQNVSDKTNPIEETDEFSIEGYRVSRICDLAEFDKFYKKLAPLGKPIEVSVRVEYRDEIEKKYDISNCVITYFAGGISFDEYLELNKLGIKNLWIRSANIYLESISEEELRKQLYAYIRDRRVKMIVIYYNSHTEIPPDNVILPSIPIEYATCTKVYETPLFNPQNAEDVLFFNQRITYIENVSCDTLIFCDNIKKVGKNVSCKNVGLSMLSFGKEIDKINNLECVAYGDSSFSDGLEAKLREKNISMPWYGRTLTYLENDYNQYINDKDIVYLSGYVNVKNKPKELSDAEWDHVLILKEKVKEFVNRYFRQRE